MRRAVEWKGREQGKPLLVLFAGREQLRALGVEASSGNLDRFFAIWPAPLTVVLPLSRPVPAALGAPSLAVRLPAHERLRALLARVGPLTGTSLNRSGEPPCSRPEEIERLGIAGLDLLVDGGPTSGGLASTLIDATVEPPRLVRRGPVAWPPDTA